LQIAFIEFVIIVRSDCHREEALFFLAPRSCELSKVILWPLISNITLCSAAIGVCEDCFWIDILALISPPIVCRSHTTRYRNHVVVSQPLKHTRSMVCWRVMNDCRLIANLPTTPKNTVCQQYLYPNTRSTIALL